MRVLLYDEGVGEELDLEEIARYLRQKLGQVKVELRENPLAGSVPQDSIAEYARKIASIKVSQVSQEVLSGQKPLYGEIEFEKRRILGKTKAFGVLYDGFHLQRVFRDIVPAEERRLDFVHIIFTNRMFGTWDDSNKRYHIRTSIYGIPSLVSTTGLVEAPAKPREYYLVKQQYQSLGRDLTTLKDSFKGRFIDYDDERLTEVAKGYAMQAVFYSLTGDPFCADKGCRLYNAHWQEELIFAQLGSGYEFCRRHTDLLEKARAGGKKT